MLQIIPSAVLVLSLLSFTAWGFFKNRPWGYAGIWFFGILGPTSSFLPVAIELVSEHRMYLPLAGIIVLIVALAYVAIRYVGEIERISQEGVYRGAIYLSGATICLLCLVTMRRNMDYDNTVTVWRRVLDVVPENARAHTNLATELSSRGQLEEALYHYRRSNESLPDNPVTHYNLGLILSKLGNLDEAAKHYRRAVEIKGDFFLAHYGLASLYFRQGQFDACVEYLEELVSSYPHNSTAHTQLGIVYLELKRIERAIEHLNKALELQSDNAQAREYLKLALQQRDG
jgi:tetratricopeptide (TPR) repeat protein